MISLFLNFDLWITKLIHGLLIVSLIGTFAGSLVSRIPFVGPYAHLVRTISILVLLVSIFGEGYLYANRKWESAVKEYQDKVAIAEKKAEDANKSLEEKSKDLNKKINDNKKTLQDEIKKQQTKIDAECKVAKEAVKILNDAAIGVKK
jgi:hypothetical protein